MQPAIIWYHGTTSASGMETGDWIDPSRGAFEGGVWATSSLTIARQWARAADALHDFDDEPTEAVVFEVEVCTDEVAEVETDEADAPAAEVVIVRNGEASVPTLFVRGLCSARVGRQVETGAR